MKDGRAKIGTETRNLDSQPGVTADRVRRMRGTFLSHTAKPKEKWRAEVDAVGIVVKEKKHLAQKWHRPFTMVEVAVTGEKQEERERCMIRDQLVKVEKEWKKRTK